MFGFTTRRRNRLRARPFPDSWLAILQRNVPVYQRLSASEQRELQDLIKIFVAEKHFEGCGGLAITDEIKVTIAAVACILLLRRQHDYYHRLQSILVYPDAYAAPVVRPGPAQTVEEGHEIRAGESWRTGLVVLSWSNVLHRPSDPNEARNVVLHEFAHQLDSEKGYTDGTPLLPRSSMYAAWARVLGREYRSLLDDTMAERPTLLDKYGATAPAEFFAVATEYFFEQPHRLKERHPELYEEFKAFYGQDPAARTSGEDGPPPPPRQEDR